MFSYAAVVSTYGSRLVSTTDDYSHVTGQAFYNHIENSTIIVWEVAHEDDHLIVEKISGELDSRKDYGIFYQYEWEGNDETIKAENEKIQQNAEKAVLKVESGKTTVEADGLVESVETEDPGPGTVSNDTANHRGAAPAATEDPGPGTVSNDTANHRGAAPAATDDPGPGTVSNDTANHRGAAPAATEDPGPGTVSRDTEVFTDLNDLIDSESGVQVCLKRVLPKRGASLAAAAKAAAAKAAAAKAAVSGAKKSRSVAAKPKELISIDTSDDDDLNLKKPRRKKSTANATDSSDDDDIRLPKKRGKSLNARNAKALNGIESDDEENDDIPAKRTGKKPASKPDQSNSDSLDDTSMPTEIISVSKTNDTDVLNRLVSSNEHLVKELLDANKRFEASFQDQINYHREKEKHDREDERLKREAARVLELREQDARHVAAASQVKVDVAKILSGSSKEVTSEQIEFMRLFM
jgi:hypothetical protein